MRGLGVYLALTRINFVRGNYVTETCAPSRPPAATRDYVDSMSKRRCYWYRDEILRENFINGPRFDQILPV